MPNNARNKKQHFQSLFKLLCTRHENKNHPPSVPKRKKDTGRLIISDVNYFLNSAENAEWWGEQITKLVETDGGEGNGRKRWPGENRR
jgi:hypothetical protein